VLVPALVIGMLPGCGGGGENAGDGVQPVPVTYPVSVTVTGGGKVTSAAGIDCGSTCSADVAASTRVVPTAQAAAGQVLQGWGGACGGTGSTCTLTMSGARSVTAAFVAATAPLPAWGPAAPLETSEDFNVTEDGLVHRVNAIASNGNAMVIWQQPDGQPNGGVSKVYARLYVAGQGWQPAVQVPGMSDFANRQLVGGRLFLDNQGVATWIRPGLDTRRFTVPGGWSAPFMPPGAPSGAGQLVSAVMDEAGNIRALTNGNDVYSLTLPAGGVWRDWVRLDASGSLSTDAAVMARSSDGSAMAIWVERNPGDANDSMKVARFDPTAGWQVPVTIDDSFDDVDQTSPPHVAMDGAGNAQLVYVAVDRWPDPASPEISVYARQLPWGQAWGPQELLETHPGGIKTWLAVAFASGGGAIASSGA
jgi:hypothetical protein